MPSLTQLNEAVLAFIEEHPDALITVVVDATFGHRIDKKEVKAFDEAVANNELVTPPAGAVGRGDAFVLSIANKAKAGILSNDSFQEFHGQYGWLFDDGRLIGGKPVPHVGWVFVERLPVRGPKSRQSLKDAKSGDKPVDKASEGPCGVPVAEVVRRSPNSRCQFPPHRRPGRRSPHGEACRRRRRGRRCRRIEHDGRRPRFEGQRPAPVPRLRRAPPRRHRMHRRRRELRLARCVCPLRRRPGVPADAADGRSASPQRAGGGQDRRSSGGRHRRLRPRAPQRRRRARLRRRHGAHEPVAATPEPAPTTRRRSRTKEVAPPTPVAAVEVVAEVEPESAPKPRPPGQGGGPSRARRATGRGPDRTSHDPKASAPPSQGCAGHAGCGRLAPVEPVVTPEKAPSKRATRRPAKQPAKQPAKPAPAKPAPVEPVDVPTEKPAPRRRAAKATATTPPAVADVTPAPKKRTRATKTPTTKES